MFRFDELSAVTAAVNFAMGGTVLATVFLALEYYGGRQWTWRVTAASAFLLAALAGAVAVAGGPLEFVAPSGLLAGISLLALIIRSDAFLWIIHLLLRPAALGCTLLIASLGAAVAVQIAANWPTNTLEVPAVVSSSYHTLDGVVAVTDLGRPIPLFAYDDDGSLPEAEQGFLGVEQYKHQIIRLGDPSAESNCHGWVYTGGRYAIQGRHVEALLQDNGYIEVGEPVADDIVVYRLENGEVAHTGRVRLQDGEGLILIESKWGPLGVYLHPLMSQPYGARYTFYHSPRAGHGISVVGRSSVADFDAVLARALDDTAFVPKSNLSAVRGRGAKREVFERPILKVPGQRKT
jgi:hypothetical protein